MYKHILLATDLDENHFNVCEQAVEIAKCFQGTLHLLHVISPPTTLQIAQGLGFAEFDSPVKDDALSVMSVLGEALNIPASQQHVEIGPITFHILDLANKLNCTLIILGSHTASLMSFDGNTAKDILQHASCDVLTLHTKK